MDNLVITLPVLLESMVKCVKLVQLKVRSSIGVFMNKYQTAGNFFIEKRNLANAL
jgi:hypothetical protein